MGHQKGKDRTPGGGKEYYETCPDFFCICNYEFRYMFDAAASDFNTKCDTYITKEQNSLVQLWHKMGNSVWLNPPYSRGMVPAFLEKCWLESQKGITVTALVHTCTDVKYWGDWVWDKAAEVRHVSGRLKFWLPHPDKKGNYGTTSDLPHSLIVYRPYYLGKTYQSIWNWKEDYIQRFDCLPVRNVKKADKQITHYIYADGRREAA